MIAETLAYRLLSQNKEFNDLLNQIRGSEFGNGFKQGIFTYDIPEKPINLKKQNLAPLMRINTTYESPYHYMDDILIATEQRILIEFWCKTASQSDKIAALMDKLLVEGGFEIYTTNEKPRYKDNDIDLLMNVKKYRFFDWCKKENNEVNK